MIKMYKPKDFIFKAVRLDIENEEYTKECENFVGDKWHVEVILKKHKLRYFVLDNGRKIRVRNGWYIMKDIMGDLRVYHPDDFEGLFVEYSEFTNNVAEGQIELDINIPNLLGDLSKMEAFNKTQRIAGYFPGGEEVDGE